MTPLYILAGIAGAVLLLGFFFRVNAVFLFLGVAAGNLLVVSLSDDTDLVLGAVAKGVDSELIAPLTLLALPVLFILLFLRKTIPAHKIFIQLPALLASSLMLAVLLLPLLPEAMTDEIYKTEYGDTIKSTKDVVIGVAVLFTLFLSWFSYRHKAEGKKKHK